MKTTTTREALATVTTNTTPMRDGTPCTRTAIQLGEACTSVDVLARDGSLLCRLNLFDFGAQGGNVDVILGEQQRGTLLAWHKGAEDIRHATPAGTTVHAVAIGSHTLCHDGRGCCGCSGDCPKSEPCPKAYNCGCGRGVVAAKACGLCPASATRPDPYGGGDVCEGCYQNMLHAEVDRRRQRALFPGEGV